MLRVTSVWNIVVFLVIAWDWNPSSRVVGKGIQSPCNFQDPDVKHFDVKISTTKIPTNLTTYVCQIKTIPFALDRDFHAIGFLPLIANKDIVHHMLLFGCPQMSSQGDIHRCGGKDNECRHFLVQWSRGLEGPICNHPDAGVRFGLRSVKSLSLQIHWNNQHNLDGLQDSSGFRIYYTSTLRKYDVGNVQIGQNHLKIQPGQSHFPQSGSCSSECTDEWLAQPIYLTRAHIHMHYTGAGGSMHILRGESEVLEVLNDPIYDYDKPPAHSFPQPVKVMPGDEIRVTCLFNTKDGQRSRNHTMYWGEGSDGEMCYAFVTYYPIVKDFNQCIQFDQFDICTKDGFAPLGDCIFPGFVHVFKGMGDEIVHQCTSPTNSNETSSVIEEDTLCSVNCKKAIFEVTDHPCMQGELKRDAELHYLPEVTIWPKVKAIMDEATSMCHEK